MSNLVQDEDGLIIIGVDEEKGYSIQDVSNDPNRKDTHELVKFLRDNGIDTAAQLIVDYIDGKFKNLRQKADADAYRRIKEGGEPAVVTYIPCDECGEFYIASDDTYAPKGTCLNCGAKHILNVCERCGNHFVGKVDEKEPRLCDNCLLYIGKE